MLAMVEEYIKRILPLIFKSWGSVAGSVKEYVEASLAYGMLLIIQRYLARYTVLDGNSKSAFRVSSVRGHFCEHTERGR